MTVLLSLLMVQTKESPPQIRADNRVMRRWALKIDNRRDKQNHLTRETCRMVMMTPKKT